ncbi:MAG: tetratricopeptide repeat protein [Agarilytica sp.]
MINKIAQMAKPLIVGTGLFIGASVISVATDRVASGISVSFVSTAEAQKKKIKTRRLPGIKEATMKRLAKITELTNPDTEKNPNAKPNFNEALKELKSMERWCNKSCNDYEKAQVFRFYAFSYYSLEDYPKAIGAYKQVVSKSPNIPIAVELDSLSALSQLHYAQEDYRGALKYLNDWMALNTSKVPADKIFLRCTIHYANNDKTSALKDCNKAIADVESRGKVAKESWYNLQVALNLEKERYKESKPILEKLIVNYPKAKWWTRYANVSGLLGSEKTQLAALDATNVMGGLQKRQDIVNTAYLYMGADAPYKGAQVLKSGMDSGKVERNVKYLKILANAYRASKEPKKAIKVLNEAAKKAKKEDAANKGKKKYRPVEGNVYAELVSLYGIDEQNKEAISAGKKALAAGQLKRACEVHTNMGISYVELGQFKSAISSFQQARKEKACRAYVSSWIKYAQNEQKSKEALAR